MTKPIFIIRFPDSVKSKKIAEGAVENLKGQLIDYHVIAFIESGCSRIEFECYNVNNQDEISFDELLNKINEYMKTDSGV
jgi:hypothetical protein